MYEFPKNQIFIKLGTGCITPKRVTSGGINLRGLAPGQHSSEETSQRWRDAGDTVSNLIGLVIESKTNRAAGDAFKRNMNRMVF